MKITLITALLFSTIPAFAGDFSLNIEGKSFTCSEGGGGGCVCKRDPSNTGQIGAYVGDIKVNGNWYADESGVRGCKAWIKQNPDTCE
jgi:hypothetical protein